MRLLTFVDPGSGTLHVGALSRDAARVVDLTVIGLDDMFMAVERAANLARIASHLVESEGAVGHAVDQVRIVAPMPGARCVHQGLPSPGGLAPGRALAIAGDAPLAFTDPGPLLGPGDEVTARAGDRWALAVAAVLGAGGRDVPEEHALRLVAGYCIAGRWLADAANADGTPAMQLGPWLVTPDDAGAEGTARPARIVVDDVAVATGTWAVGAEFARLAARASRQFELRPGDVLTTLVPASGGGACAAPLAAGQRVRLEVEGLGALPATVV
jgi:hypothetical protein